MTKLIPRLTTPSQHLFNQALAQPISTAFGHDSQEIHLPCIISAGHGFSSNDGAEPVIFNDPEDDDVATLVPEDGAELVADHVLDTLRPRRIVSATESLETRPVVSAERDDHKCAPEGGATSCLPSPGRGKPSTRAYSCAQEQSNCPGRDAAGRPFLPRF